MFEEPFGARSVHTCLKREMACSLFEETINKWSILVLEADEVVNLQLRSLVLQCLHVFGVFAEAVERVCDELDHR